MQKIKKDVTQELLIREQPQFTVNISIANLDQFNNLICEIKDKLNELKNFKFEIETKK